MVEGFDTEAAKKRFLKIYLLKYAKPNSGIGFPGAFDLVSQCKKTGLKVAVAFSADRIKVNANLAAAGLPITMLDAIVTADAFRTLKPAPDIFLAESRILDIAVTTTLSEDTLKAAEPSLIRKEISDISLEDILDGDSGSHNVMVQESQSINDLALSSPESNMTGRITELDNYPISEALWASHGDDISIQYSGTPALKGNFVRCGHRTAQGVLADGWRPFTEIIYKDAAFGNFQISMLLSLLMDPVVCAWRSVCVNVSVKLIDEVPERSSVRVPKIQKIFGVIGILKLLAGSYVLVITNRECVGSYFGHPIFKVSSMKFYPCYISLSRTLLLKRSDDSTGKRKFCDRSSPVVTLHSNDRDSPVEKRKCKNDSHLVSTVGPETPEQKSQSSSTNRYLRKHLGAPIRGRSSYQMYFKLECERLKKILGESSGSKKISDMAINAWKTD
ncbi:hypothetical protein KY284_004319 [Solanum tuberosum]|nr:hypothetical protein KY284_004319 [Solanum tuberosum]